MRARDLVAYHGAILRRASQDTARFGLKHLGAEIAVAVAGAVVTLFLTPDPNPLLALFGGVLTAIILFAVYFIFYLLLAPTEIHVEQENQLAKYVPVQAPRSYRGSIDFAYDVEKNISAGRLQAVTEQIGDEANRIGEQMRAANDELQQNAPVARQRRIAIKLGKEIQAGARRYRRLHQKYKTFAAAFGETFKGATPLFVAQYPPEEVRVATEGAIRARESTKDLQLTIGQTRRKLSESLSGRQEQITIGIEQLDFVMKDIENTAEEIVKTFDKIIKMMNVRAK